VKHMLRSNNIFIEITNNFLQASKRILKSKRETKHGMLKFPSWRCVQKITSMKRETIQPTRLLNPLTQRTQKPYPAPCGTLLVNDGKSGKRNIPYRATPHVIIRDTVEQINAEPVWTHSKTALPKKAAQLAPNSRRAGEEWRQREKGCTRR
jgi:hypothetical protein